MADCAEVLLSQWYFFERRLWRRWELIQWGLERSVFVVIVLAAARFDFLPFIFNCWFAPALMVGVTLGLFFDYLPPAVHVPESLDQRTDLSGSVIMKIMGQNYHLVHHLWPSILGLSTSPPTSYQTAPGCQRLPQLRHF